MREVQCSCYVYICLSQFLNFLFSFLSHMSSWSDFRSESWLHSVGVIFKTCSSILLQPSSSFHHPRLLMCWYMWVWTLPLPQMHGPWSMFWLKYNWEADCRYCMLFFFTQKQVLTVYKCLGLKQYLLWRSVHSSGLLMQLWFVVWLMCIVLPCLWGEAGGWKRGAVMFSCGSVTSLNYLLTGWYEFVFVQTYSRYIFQSRWCVCLWGEHKVFFLHNVYLFFPPNIFFFLSIFTFCCNIKVSKTQFVTVRKLLP